MARRRKLRKLHKLRCKWLLTFKVAWLRLYLSKSRPIRFSGHSAVPLLAALQDAWVDWNNCEQFNSQHENGLHLYQSEKHFQCKHCSSIMVIPGAFAFAHQTNWPNRTSLNNISTWRWMLYGTRAQQRVPDNFAPSLSFRWFIRRLVCWWCLTG